MGGLFRDLFHADREARQKDGQKAGPSKNQLETIYSNVRLVTWGGIETGAEKFFLISALDPFNSDLIKFNHRKFLNKNDFITKSIQGSFYPIPIWFKINILTSEYSLRLIP